MRIILIIIIDIGIRKAERKMKYSKQREIILNKLREFRVHPSAEQLYLKLLEDGENIGLATVYRNLNYLAEAGVIKRFQTFEKSERFDGTISPHHHFLCKKCGKIFDLPKEIAEQVVQNINDKGFKTLNYEIMAEGLCTECQKEGEK